MFFVAFPPIDALLERSRLAGVVAKLLPLHNNMAFIACVRILHKLLGVTKDFMTYTDRTVVGCRTYSHSYMKL